jgi:hypothetical protein
MTRFTLVRRGCGAAAVLLVGLSAGCRSQQHQRDCCACKDAVACATSAASSTKVVAETKPEPKAVANDSAPLPPPPGLADKSEPSPKLLPSTKERYSAPPAPKPVYLPPPAPQMPTASVMPPAQPAPAEVVLKSDDTVHIPPVAGRAYSAPRAIANAPLGMGRSPDYTVLTGEIFFYQQKNQWRLRFASIDEEDRYGGCVTLDALMEMKEFRSGDLVTVRGELVNRESRDRAPLYRVHEIIPVQR